MRVIAGEAKGRRLKGPPSTATRPMADKIKEALFSSLGSLGVEPDRVLDLYAGTGSVGIEALSRGAESAEFVDQSRAAAAVIHANLTTTGFAERCQVHTMSVVGFIDRATQPFDLVIMDPPYAAPDIADVLERIAASRLVQSGSILAVGHWPRLSLPERVGALNRLRERCHGDSCFSIYEFDDTPGEDDHA